ncbi:MAG: hypothetical protein Q8L68_06600 [Methylococcales bacterium]|nr:hypothetical protein [Methylococcales bacterium]
MNKNKLSEAVKNHQYWQATGDGTAKTNVDKIFSPLSTGTGISDVRIEEINQHRINLLVRYKGRNWSVMLMSTFHGIQVMVKGNDTNGAKREIAQVFIKEFQNNTKPHIYSLKEAAMSTVPAYEITSTNQEVIIKLNRSLIEQEKLAQFLDYLSIRSMEQKSRLTEEWASELINEVDNAVWEKQKGLFDQ